MSLTWALKTETDGIYRRCEKICSIFLWEFFLRWSGVFQAGSNSPFLCFQVLDYRHGLHIPPAFEDWQAPGYEREALTLSTQASSTPLCQFPSSAPGGGSHQASRPPEAKAVFQHCSLASRYLTCTGVAFHANDRPGGQQQSHN